FPRPNRGPPRRDPTVTEPAPGEGRVRRRARRTSPTRHLAPLDGDLPHKGGGVDRQPSFASPLVGEVDAEAQRGVGWGDSRNDHSTDRATATGTMADYEI